MLKILKMVAIFAIIPGSNGLVLAQDEKNPMTFFITSVGSGKGGNLGGIEGADAHCQSLADAVGAGAGNRTWRAYLSTSDIDARDRIGDGPWHNVKGELIATDVEDLHTGNDNITQENSYNESGGRIPGIAQGDAATHDMLTGSKPDGTLALVTEGLGGIPAHKTGEPATCGDWNGGDARARVGHFDSQGGEPGTVWNSAHYSFGCTQEEIEKNASVGLFYCFASD
ncbi:MAG: hypothetical protein ACR2Q3_10395 [Woeseiaceae bacterium]